MPPRQSSGTSSPYEDSSDPGGARLDFAGDDVASGPIDPHLVKECLGPLPKPPHPDIDVVKNAVFGGASEVDFVDLCNERFNSVFGRREEPLRRMKARLESSVERKGAEVGSCARHHASTDRYRQIPGERHPWSFGPAAKVTLLLLASLVLVLIGLLATARILMASGMAGFDTPDVAYVFSFLGPATALVVKCLSSRIPGDRGRRLYAVCVGVMGGLLGLVWFALFVTTFPPAGFDVADVIRSAANPGTASEGETGHGVALMFVQLCAEVFASAFLWLETERIFELHRPVGMSANPAHALTRKFLNGASAELQVLDRHLGDVAGVLKEIDGLRAVYVGESRWLFRQSSAFAGNAASFLQSRLPEGGGAVAAPLAQ